jgi:Ca2+-binding RTX toxin-like protein
VGVIVPSTSAPPAFTSADQSLVATAVGSDTTVPIGYQALYDVAGSDTVNGGDNNMTVFLQGGLTTGTVFNTGDGNDGIWAGGADTIEAGTGSTTIGGGVGGVTVAGGTGNLGFYGGAGAVSVVAGQAGSATIFGSTNGTSFLAGGSGNNTLVGGTGSAESILFGGNNATEWAEGTGTVEMIAGSGVTQMAGQSGSGDEIMYTQHGTAIMALNNAADSVFGGEGAATVTGGAGKDIYGFIAGYTGGTETIIGLKASDVITFGGYGADPIASESVVDGSDLIVLNDGTRITIAGIDHKIFNGNQ